MADFYTAPLSADEARKQAEKLERERIIMQLAAQELNNQLSGHPAGFSGAAGAQGPANCPTQARERHQQRLATIKALCAAVRVLTDDL